MNNETFSKDSKILIPLKMFIIISDFFFKLFYFIFSRFCCLHIQSYSFLISLRSLELIGMLLHCNQM